MEAITYAAYRLVAHRHDALPALAWVARVDHAQSLVTLQYGPRVEVRPHFWIEGVWNGPFAAGQFGETDCVFGTGGIIGAESVRFVANAATTDSLYYQEDGAGVHVSNSLPLLLASIGDRLDPHYHDYPAVCHSIIHGIDDYRRDIPTQHGLVHRHLYRNLEVSMGTVRFIDKRLPPRFPDFAAYRNYLRDNYALLAANARDPDRTWPLPIVSTQSKGYDSTAMNALARPYGLESVFTLSTGKSGQGLAHQEGAHLPDDDGGAICEVLGLPYVRLNRRAFADHFEDESLYYCALHHNQDTNLMEIRQHIAQPSVLLTGTLGEIWYPTAILGQRAYLDGSLRRWDLGGHGMSEWRLVAGLIHLPVPYIGARRKADIVAITDSPEMDPWRVGTAYDRPIPRRIAEEAGVPRQLFGQSKMGSVVLFAQPSIPYGKALRREFLADLAAQHILSRTKAWCWPVVRWVNAMVQVKTSRRYALIYYAERVLSKFLRRQVQTPRLWTHLDGALYCYCVNRTADSYPDMREPRRTP